SGKVIDAETKQPITSFRYRTGFRWRGQQVLWQRNVTVQGEGRYQVRERQAQPGYLVRIDADGYLPAVSREIKADEGAITIDFELLKGKTVVASVLTPEGAPAVGAKVALVDPGPQALVVRQGLVQREVGKRVDGVGQGETDQTGKFRLEAKKDDFLIQLTHKSGYAELAGLPSASPRVIKLAPWARIEGTFQVARRPEPDVEVSLNSGVNFGRLPAAAKDSAQPTDSRGRFVFEQVVPGENRILCRRTSDSGTASSVSLTVDCLAGQTTHVEFGAAAAGGRPVIGQLHQPADATSEVELSAAQIYVFPRQQGGERPTSQLQFNVAPDREGNFCIDDVPPGSYFLNVFFPGTRGFRVPVRTIVVPKVDEKLSQRPVDLGVLTLRRMPAVRPGAARKAARILKK
ncbi:MAG TPA: hypothetical protein VEI07_12660, partial [Planctomycetaceae bacterium]|nr:hypothetical protein [Planctomycetaceae bacterium]